MFKTFFSLILIVIVSFGNSNYYYAFDKKVFLTPISSSSSQKLTKKRYFKTSKGFRVSVEDTIIIKLKKNSSIDDVLNKYQLTLKQKLTSTLYLVKIPFSSKILDLANALHRDKMITYAHPNFTKKVVKR